MKPLIKTKTAPFNLYQKDDFYIVERGNVVEFKSKYKERCMSYIQLQQKQLQKYGTTRFPILEF